jgi:hypothetical protein
MVQAAAVDCEGRARHGVPAHSDLILQSAELQRRAMPLSVCHKTSTHEVASEDEIDAPCQRKSTCRTVRTSA